MEARFHLGWVMTVVYAAGGIFLVFTGTRQERTPLLLMGLGALPAGTAARLALCAEGRKTARECASGSGLRADRNFLAA